MRRGITAHQRRMMPPNELWDQKYRALSDFCQKIEITGPASTGDGMIEDSGIRTSLASAGMLCYNIPP
jgi:hypothetical protein